MPPPAEPDARNHFDGNRFFNPPGILPAPPTAPSPPRKRGGRARTILQWQLGERPRWPAWVVDPVPGGSPRADPAPGEITVTFIGHATFLPRIDLVLVSHCHYDHLDLPSLRAIRRRDNPAIITLPGNARHIRKAGLRRVVERDWWQNVTLEGLRITATPARHGSARTPFDHNRALWGGFMVQAEGGTRATPAIFFAGDSGHGQHWRWIRNRLSAPDLALLPVGAYEPRALMRAVHVNPEESVEAFQTLGASWAVPMHYGTFQLTDEPMDEPLARTRAACLAAGIDPARFAALGFGETRGFTFPATAITAEPTPGSRAIA